MKIFNIKVLLIMIVFLSGYCHSEEKNKDKKKKTLIEAPIKLQSNFIGDKEQPLVSYFIPWNEIGTPDKLQWNLDSKYDKTLNLVDRKVMLRSSSMYDTMKLENSSPKIEEEQ